MPERCACSLKVNQLWEVLSVCFCQPFPWADVRTLCEHALLSWAAGTGAGHLCKWIGREGQLLTYWQVTKKLNPPPIGNTFGNTVPQVRRLPGELKQTAWDVNSPPAHQWHKEGWVFIGLVCFLKTLNMIALHLGFFFMNTYCQAWSLWCRTILTSQIMKWEVNNCPFAVAILRDKWMATFHFRGVQFH